MKQYNRPGQAFGYVDELIYILLALRVISEDQYYFVVDNWDDHQTLKKFKIV